MHCNLEIAQMRSQKQIILCRTFPELFWMNKVFVYFLFLNNVVCMGLNPTYYIVVVANCFYFLFEKLQNICSHTGYNVFYFIVFSKYSMTVYRP